LELGSARIATSFNDFSPTIRIKHAFEKLEPYGPDRYRVRERMMWRDFSKTLRELLQMPGDAGAYRPDLHYMRGPGPKWHAKYGALSPKTSPASAARSPVLRDLAGRRA
jgi:hypothetical protein